MLFFFAKIVELQNRWLSYFNWMNYACTISEAAKQTAANCFYKALWRRFTRAKPRLLRLDSINQSFILCLPKSAYIENKFDSSGQKRDTMAKRYTLIHAHVTAKVNILPGIYP